jgi:hypothetical protein
MEQLAAQAKSSGSTRPMLGPAQRRPWIWIVLAALAAGAGSALVLVLAPARDAPKAAGVVVIEKQGEAPPAESTPAPEPVADVARAPAAASVPVPAESATATGSKSAGRAPASGAAPLAQAFQRQGAKIQRCFEQSPGNVPGMSVRFQVDTAGKVQNAVVTPASVAGTPLGACIAGVARATTFGPQPEPVAFSIPIAARVVKR